MQRPLRPSVPLLALIAALSATAAVAKTKKKAEVADDGLPSVEQVAAQARTVFEDLRENSTPLVRRAVFEGLLALGAKEDQAKALDFGLAESDWTIRERALGLALTDKDKARTKAAWDVVQRLLESDDAEDRARGMALVETHGKKGERSDRLKLAAKNGTPPARAAARVALIAEGGKTAWTIIEAGLREPPGEPEHKEALEALRTITDPVAVDWALSNVHGEGTIGRIARDYLVRLEEPKAVKKAEAALNKEYEKSDADFEPRLRVASILARRGQAQRVERTLRAALRLDSPSARALAWEGLQGLRDREVLEKLKPLILSNEEAAEADGAYGWLAAWARQSSEPKVLEILQEAARSDRRTLRMRALAILTELKHRGSVTVFEAGMTEGQREVRLAAAKGLAAVAKPGDEQRLADYLRKEREVDVKLALIEGLANIGTPAIIAPLQFLVTAREPEIKRAVLSAVVATGKPEAATLLGLLKRDPDVDLRFDAWHSLLRLQPQSAAEFKAGALAWLTPGHVEKLGQDAQIPVEILEDVARRGDDAQRVFAVDALRARGAAGATRLLGLVEGQHPDTAASSLRALAELRKEESLPTYRNALKSAHGEVRAEAFDAIGQFGGPGLLETALAGMADKEPLARARAALAALRLARRGGE